MTWQPIPSDFLIYEENFVFSFIGAEERKLEISNSRKERKLGVSIARKKGSRELALQGAFVAGDEQNRD